MNKIDIIKAVLALQPDDTIGIFALQMKLQQELATEIFAGTTGNPTDKTRVSNVIKLLTYMQNKRPQYARVYRDTKGRQMITNEGQNTVIFKDELPLTQWEPQEKPGITPEQIDRILEQSQVDRNKTVVINRKHITYYKSLKKTYVNIYGVLFSVENLKKTVDVSGEIEIHLNTEKPLTPCYFTGYNCEGALAPCRPFDD